MTALDVNVAVERLRRVREQEIVVRGERPEQERGQREQNAAAAEQAADREPGEPHAPLRRSAGGRRRPGATVPVTYEARSDARKQTTSAISAGVPRRPSATGSRSGRREPPGLSERSRSVSIRPGAIVLTVMPSGPSSRASVLSQPTTPGRTAFESARFAIGSFTDVDSIATMRPRPLARRCGRREPDEPDVRDEQELDRGLDLLASKSRPGPAAGRRR